MDNYPSASQNSVSEFCLSVASAVAAYVERARQIMNDATLSSMERLAAAVTDIDEYVMTQHFLLRSGR